GQAQIRFGGRIRLKEHFRCMPEIIRFSNELCYQDEPLLPLRQYPPQRLEPLVTRFVADGYREGEGNYTRNRPEAETLVAEIVGCCRDPRYAQKTMGVISLLGESQAKLIESLVLEHLDPTEIERRELTFGDAYAFQGDERDIMFLSVVAAPNVRNATLSDKTAEQRFNVAASRARDQVWLFHSVSLTDLKAGDIRYRLLSYYLNPAAPPPGEPEWEKCESEFESRVGRIIHARGYRLVPQHEPFGPRGYRLDFVVDGTATRLAVECDGDSSHSSPEQVHDDLVRQRRLERCGWVFWRVRESEFYANRERAMASLWRRLEELGIKPHSDSESDATGSQAASGDAPPTTPPAQPNPPAYLPVSPTIAKKPEEIKILAAPAHPREIAVPREFDFAGAQQELEIPSRIEPKKETGPIHRNLVERTVLELLVSNHRMDLAPLLLEVSRQLGLARDQKPKIEQAIQSLEGRGLVKVGVNYVALIASPPS
ncbi:MAG: AAA domain-containing protein, partial [Opitutaceae bacterium]